MPNCYSSSAGLNQEFLPYLTCIRLTSFSATCSIEAVSFNFMFQKNYITGKVATHITEEDNKDILSYFKIWLSISIFVVFLLFFFVVVVCSLSPPSRLGLKVSKKKKRKREGKGLKGREKGKVQKER